MGGRRVIGSTETKYRNKSRSCCRQRWPGAEWESAGQGLEAVCWLTVVMPVEAYGASWFRMVSAGTGVIAAVIWQLTEAGRGRFAHCTCASGGNS